MSKTAVARPGRNEPCHCGSGRKYKHCCLEQDESAARLARANAAANAGEASPEALPAARRAPKHTTQQPWKASPTRGAHQRVRTPRKVGGS